jgi:hypothetical protein
MYLSFNRRRQLEKGCRKRSYRTRRLIGPPLRKRHGLSIYFGVLLELLRSYLSCQIPGKLSARLSSMSKLQIEDHPLLLATSVLIIDSLDQCSNSKLIFRFIYTLVANTQSNLRGKHAPSLSTIQGLWLYTIEFLKFQHRDLRQHYTEYDEKRISTWLDQQVTLGKLIRGRWVERQWLGLVMILKLVRAMVEHSLAQGCLSWDIIIVKILGVVLACACNSRSGDVARSDGYTNMEYLQFQHVELTLRTGGTSAQDLRAKVTLKYTKEFKSVLIYANRGCRLMPIVY